MKWIRYSHYTGEDLGIGAEDLLQALSDFLLESGFNSQYMPFSEWNQHTLEDLKNAIQRALEQGDMFDPDQAERVRQALEKHKAQSDDITFLMGKYNGMRGEIVQMPAAPAEPAKGS